MAIVRDVAATDVTAIVARDESRERSLKRQLRRYLPIAIGALLAVAMIVMAAAAPYVAPLSPSAQFSDAVLKGPGAQDRHLLGTDEFGRDVWSRIIWGARVIIVTALGGTLANEILAIGVALTPNFIRLSRSLALTIREQDYILAARALGSGQIRVMARHVFPNALYALVVVGTLYIATAIRTEAGLSFLGLGIPPPTPSWATSSARAAITSSAARGSPRSRGWPSCWPCWRSIWSAIRSAISSTRA